MIDKDSLQRLKARVTATGVLEHPVVHQVEPQFRTPSQYTFNPVLVAKIVNQQKAAEKDAVEKPE